MFLPLPSFLSSCCDRTTAKAANGQVDHLLVMAESGLVCFNDVLLCSRLDLERGTYHGDAMKLAYARTEGVTVTLPHQQAEIKIHFAAVNRVRPHLDLENIHRVGLKASQ